MVTALTIDSISTPQRLPLVVGENLRVPLVTGESVRYANFDHAASTPCLAAVHHSVEQFLPWYASSHRGAGFASRITTETYEKSRTVVHDFVGAGAEDTIIFTRNTTDAFNLLAHCVPVDTSIVVFDTEHHAALLPWQGKEIHRLRLPRTRAALLSTVDETLRRCSSGPKLVVLTGASNITGELFPIADIASVARQHGARIAVDAAQLAAHHNISMQKLDIDYLALSGHKMYAPFGVGALIGRKDWLDAAPPYLSGGGASKLVSHHGQEWAVEWNTGPARHEAGSPNTVGTYALAVACQEISKAATEIAAHEQQLFQRLRDGLSALSNISELRLFDDVDNRVPTTSFVIDGIEAGKVAAILSAEYGIGVRHGAFCAHVATQQLLRHVGSREPHAIRASLGLGTTADQVDRLIDALRVIVASGPKWSYTHTDGQWFPSPDHRPRPQFLT